MRNMLQCERVILRFLIVIAGFLPASGKLYAYPDPLEWTDYRWQNTSLVFNANPTPFPVGSAKRIAIVAAVDAWDSSKIRGSAMSLSVDPNSIERNVFDNFDLANTIAFVTMPDTANANIVGITVPRYTTSLPYVWLETDIKLKSGASWADNAAAAAAVSSGDTGGLDAYSTLNFEAVVRHEIGHAYHFRGHEEERLALMDEVYSFGPGESPLMQGDDRNGARSIYPAYGEQETDVTIGGWKMSYGRRQALPVEAPFASADPLGPVPAGQKLTVEYTLQNLGTEAVYGCGLRFYLSTDVNITNSDLLLASAVVDLPYPASGGNAVTPVFTEPREFTVPCTTPAGNYFVGAILNWDNAIVETGSGANTIVFPYNRNPKVIAVTSGRPAPASNVSASSGLCDRVNLTWTNNSVLSTSNRVLRDDVEVTSLSRTAMSYTDVVGPGEYTYRIVATNACGDANVGPSDSDLGTVTLPSTSPTVGASAMCAGVQVAWGWTGSGQSGFSVRRSDGQGPWPVAAILRTYSDATGTPGIAYTYSVAANYQGNCEGPAGSVLIARLARPGSPTLTTATQGACGTVTVTWSWNGANPDGFRVWRDGSVASPDLAPGARSWVDSEAAPIIGHSYQVKAFNVCGDSDASNSLTGKYFATIPQASPTAVGASDDSHCCQKIVVTWNWTGQDASGFRVYRNGQALSDTDAAARSYDDLTALEGVVYTYSVRSLNTCGVGVTADARSPLSAK